MPAFLDMMAGPGRASTEKRDSSTRNKFDDFLKAHFEVESVHTSENPPPDKAQKKAVPTFDTLPSNELTQELIGSFASYLFESVKYNTAVTHLGSLRRQLEKKYKTDIFSGSNWYSQLRKRLKDNYVERNRLLGEKLEASVPAMTRDDLQTISTTLFSRDTPTDLRNRTLILWQWSAMGRSSDITWLTYGDLHWWDTGLVLDITRIKTSSEQSLRLVCSPLSWECDAVHALASQLGKHSVRTECFPSWSSALKEIMGWRTSTLC